MFSVSELIKGNLCCSQKVFITDHLYVKGKRNAGKKKHRTDYNNICKKEIIKIAKSIWNLPFFSDIKSGSHDFFFSSECCIFVKNLMALVGFFSIKKYFQHSA